MDMKKYLLDKFNEEIASAAQTFQIELVNDAGIQKLKGFVNNVKFDMSFVDFAKKFPDVYRQIVPQLQAGEIAKFKFDNMEVYDFIKTPRTKNQVVATPDPVAAIPVAQAKPPVFKSNLAKPLIQPNVVK